MNPLVRSGRHSGITLLEVMIVQGALTMVAMLILSALTRSCTKSSRTSCIYNLKQMGISFRQWGMDHHDKFPMSLAVTNGGTMDHAFAHEAWVHYQCLSNELNTPEILVCPADMQRTPAMAFGGGFNSSNLSYFVSLDADETLPQLILSGDRNLTSNGVAVSAGLHRLRSSVTNGWTGAMHQGNGNIGLADGSVQQMSSTRLQQYLRDSPQTNRLAIP